MLRGLIKCLEGQSRQPFEKRQLQNPKRVPWVKKFLPAGPSFGSGVVICQKASSYPDWLSRHFIRPLSMLGDHCLTSKFTKIQFRNIWPYVSLYGLYCLFGLGGQIPLMYAEMVHIRQFFCKIV